MHLSDGPIDLIITLAGRRGQVAAAREAAIERFVTVLAELVSELPALRQPIREESSFIGPVARRMAVAVQLFLPGFVTPMAAVAGAVADEILSVMLLDADLDKAIVNNGGDIAFHLGPGETLSAGLVTGPPIPGRGLDGTVSVNAADGIGGIATSGRHGRSFSLGVADAVSVLARDAAHADVAATLIANAVNVDSGMVERRPASTLDPDSDLGDRPVTVNVGMLGADEVDIALGAGLVCTRDFIGRGLIDAGLLALQGEMRTAGDRLAITGIQTNGGLHGNSDPQNCIGT